jgi:hypothetical protein
VFRPVAALLHRSGLLTYLRQHWRADDTSAKQALKAQIRQEGEALAVRLARQGETVEELRQELQRLTAVVAFNGEHRERRHPDAFDASRVTAHVRQAVAAAALQSDPGPHLVVESLMPDATYAALVDAIPPDECFPSRDPIKRNFRCRPGDVLPEYTAQAWPFLEHTIVADGLVPAVLDRFRPHIERAYAERYGANAAPMIALRHGATAGRLMLRRPGYKLEPHLDPARVIVTCLVYFARPGDSERFGTQLFRIDRPPVLDRTNTYFPQEHGYRCEPAQTVPFRPNTAVIFLNHNQAHAASIPETAPKSTRRYAYQCYVSPDADAATAIVGGAGIDEA